MNPNAGLPSRPEAGCRGLSRPGRVRPPPGRDARAAPIRFGCGLFQCLARPRGFGPQPARGETGGPLKILYGLLSDLLAIRDGSGDIRNEELRDQLQALRWPCFVQLDPLCRRQD